MQWRLEIGFFKIVLLLFRLKRIYFDFILCQEVYYLWLQLDLNPEPLSF